MGAQNGVVGDSFSVEVPEMVVDQETLAEERKMAKYSKTAEFERIKRYMEGRILHYQSALPDGRPLTEVNDQERAEMWVIANAVIGEFKSFLAEFELARDAVEAHDAQ